MTKGEAAPEVDFLCMQPILNNVREKIFSPNLGKRLVKTNNDRLLDTKHAKAFNFLIESLQERRRRFRMQHGARVRIESYDCRHRACFTCPFNYRAHD
jgi:hypothetical protein